MSRKLKIVVEVHEYTDKFWPLHQHIGDAEYKGRKIQYDMSLPTYDPFLVIDGTPWTVDNGQIICKIVDQLEGQNSSEPDWKALYIGKLIEDLYFADQYSTGADHPENEDWDEISRDLAQELADLGIDPVKAVEEFSAGYNSIAILVPREDESDE